MLLRRLMAALGPLLVCIGLCAALRLLDGALGAGQFLTFALKGLLLGAALALTLPLAGVKARTTGLTPWLFAGAGLLLAALIYQYLETRGLVHSAFLASVMSINGQVVLAEGAFAGYLLAAGFWYRR